MKSIYDFRDAMGLKVYTKTFKSDGLLAHRYAGVYSAGDFASTLYDYDAGIFGLALVSILYLRTSGGFICQLAQSMMVDGNLLNWMNKCY